MKEDVHEEMLRLGCGSISVPLCLVPFTAGDALSADRITVTDMGKRVVEVPSNPQRIICLSPGTLRLIVYLGAAGQGRWG